MSTSPQDRKARDRAYGCFLIPGAWALCVTIATFSTLTPPTAAGLGYFVLLPLGLAAMVTIPVGIVLTLKVDPDPALALLAVATIAVVAAICGDYTSAVVVMTLLFTIYGLLVFALAGWWFLVRRKNLP